MVKHKAPRRVTRVPQEIHRPGHVLGARALPAREVEAGEVELTLRPGFPRSRAIAEVDYRRCAAPRRALELGHRRIVACVRRQQVDHPCEAAAQAILPSKALERAVGLPSEQEVAAELRCVGQRRRAAGVAGEEIDDEEDRLGDPAPSQD